MRHRFWTAVARFAAKRTDGYALRPWSQITNEEFEAAQAAKYDRARGYDRPREQRSVETRALTSGLPVTITWPPKRNTTSTIGPVRVKWTSWP